MLHDQLHANKALGYNYLRIVFLRIPYVATKSFLEIENRLEVDALASAPHNLLTTRGQ